MAQSLTWTLPGSWQSTWGVTCARRERPARSAVAERRAESVRAAAGLDELDEAGLVEACLSGRQGAFDLIVERHRRAVYQLCYRFVANHEDASDLSQDVFLRAYRGLRSFRRQSSLATWLYRIGVNVCLNRVTARTPPVESIEEQQHVDTRIELASARLSRSCHESSGRRSSCGCITRCRTRKSPTCSGAL